MIVDGIEKDRLHVLIGRQTRIMDVVVRVAPKPAIHVIQKQMRKFLPDV